jgi:uncharacterized protein HemX
MERRVIWFLKNWKIFAVLGLVIAILGLGVKVGYGWRDGSCLKENNERIAAEQKATAAAQKIQNEKSTALETQLASLRQTNRRVNALLDNELKHPGYSCPVPVNGLQLLREAVGGKPAS